MQYPFNRSDLTGIGRDHADVGAVQILFLTRRQLGLLTRPFIRFRVSLGY